MPGSAHVLRADAGRAPLRPGSVALICTSPPYFGLRWYPGAGDNQIGSEATPQDHLRALWRVMDQCWDALVDWGSAFVNLGQKYAGSGGHNNAGLGSSGSMKGSTLQGGTKGMLAKREADRAPKATRRTAPDRYIQGTEWARPKSAMMLPQAFVLGLINPTLYRDHIDPPGPGAQHHRWILRAPIKAVTEDGEHIPGANSYLWDKPNSLPSSKTDAVNLTHEDVFHLTKSERYFAAVDEIREPHRWEPSPGYNGHRRSDRGGGPEHTHSSLGHPLGSLPGSVWRIASEPLRLPTWKIVRAGRTVAWFVPRPAPKHKGQPANMPGFFDPKPDGRIAELRRKLGVSRKEPDTLMVNEAGVLVPKPGARDMAHEDAMKYMRAMGLRGGRPSLRPVAQHFAAFPGELPRRIILGWSPSGICTVCDEPRRPVVGKQLRVRNRNVAPVRHAQRFDGESATGYFANTEYQGSTEATILGYACACPEPTAPTRPAVVFDPFAGTGTTMLVAKALGRTGIGTDLSHAYCKLAEWRCANEGAKAEQRTWKDAQGSLL